MDVAGASRLRAPREEVFQYYHGHPGGETSGNVEFAIRGHGGPAVRRPGSGPEGGSSRPESAEILAIFRVRAPANFNLPAEYTAEMREVSGEYKVQSENWAYGEPDWTEAARTAIEERVADMVAAALKSGAGEAEIETAPAETTPAETGPAETTPGQTP